MRETFLMALTALTAASGSALGEGEMSAGQKQAAVAAVIVFAILIGYAATQRFGGRAKRGARRVTRGRTLPSAQARAVGGRMRRPTGERPRRAAAVVVRRRPRGPVITSAVVAGVVALIVVLSLLPMFVPQQGPAGPRGVAGAAGGGGGGGGVDGYSALIATVVESPGINCPTGGNKVQDGLDDGSGGGTPRNEILEAGEVSETFFTCNGATGATGAAGANGYNSLVDVQTESAGANCAAGGQKVYWGLDNGDGGGTANNNVLEVGERDGGPKYTCNGAAGTNGVDGRDAGYKFTYNTGTSGDPGSGKFGFDTVTLSAIATLRISETDGDANGISAVLATWDDSTTTAARSTITVVGDAAPTRLLVFTITSAITDNGAYDSFSVTYVTSAGSHAHNDVDRVRQARTGDQGATGGTGAAGRDAGLKYTYNTGTSGDPGSGKFGFDTVTLSAIATFRISETDGDGNGISAYIATWDDSTTTGARTTISVLGDGAPTRILVFLITSAITDNGAYDSFSVTYITSSGSHANNDVDKMFQDRTGDKGATGTTGSNGFSSLTKSTAEASGANCPSGGKKIEVGLDNGDGGGTANDGTLQAGEIDLTYYICVPNVGGKMVYFMSYGGSTPSTATQWTNMPAAPTELLGLTSMRIQTNLTGYTQVRFAVGTQVAGAANSFLWLQYSTDNSTFTNACGSTCPEVNTGAAGSKWTAWQTMNGTMAADVLLRVMGQAGDAAADPTFNEVYCEFR